VPKVPKAKPDSFCRLPSDLRLLFFRIGFAFLDCNLLNIYLFTCHQRACAKIGFVLHNFFSIAWHLHPDVFQILNLAEGYQDVDGMLPAEQVCGLIVDLNF
jgi:hypothetical protein